MIDAIDDGTAPEIYVDDLDSIHVNKNGNVCWVCVRELDGFRKVNLRVVAPVSAVPNIASMIVAAFTGQFSRVMMDKLRGIAGFPPLH